MRLSDLSSWHRFTYTQLYPAVLGSMLYDVLHLHKGWGPLQFLELSITAMYCVDYFHLQCDLGADQLPRGTWRDTVLDAAIAIVFGIAYWQASDLQLFTCYVCLTTVGVLILLYNLTPGRRCASVVLLHGGLAALLAGMAWLTAHADHVTWTVALAAWVPTLWYAIYVFTVANRALPPATAAATA